MQVYYELGLSNDSPGKTPKGQLTIIYTPWGPSKPGAQGDLFSWSDTWNGSRLSFSMNQCCCCLQILFPCGKIIFACILRNNIGNLILSDAASLAFFSNTSINVLLKGLSLKKWQGSHGGSGKRHIFKIWGHLFIVMEGEPVADQCLHMY